MKVIIKFYHPRIKNGSVYVILYIVYPHSLICLIKHEVLLT